jgi:hypothetical protein
MRLALLGLVFIFSACIFGGDADQNPGSNQGVAGTVLPGVYRGEYPEFSQAFKIVSYLVLDSDETFRFVGVETDAPSFMAKGRWKVIADSMIWNGQMSSHTGNSYDFSAWDSTLPADTAYLQNVKAGAFDRQEIVMDSLGNPLIRWVRYQQIVPAPIITGGRYEYLETFRSYPNTSRIFSSRYLVEISQDGIYRESYFVDGAPESEVEGAHWTLAGPCLIVSQIRSRVYIDSLRTFDEWSMAPQDYERVYELQNISRDSFQLWMPYRYDLYQDSAHWAHYRRLP